MISKIEVERFSVASYRSFDDVLASIKGAVGHPDMVECAKATAAARTLAELESTIRKALGKTGLMLFMEHHGAVIRKATKAKNVPDAGSYAPVTVLVDERSDGVHISYDRMTSLLAPYRSGDALAVARDLDRKPFCPNRQAELAPVR